MNDRNGPHPRLEFAAEIVREIGAELRSVEAGTLKVTEKEPEHLTVGLDRLIDEKIITQIQRAYPDDRIFTEETGFIDGTGDYLWIVDPIDGTRNLILGFPYVGIGLAILLQQETVVSVIYNPFLDELTVAEKGAGAFRNGVRIKVSENASLSTGYYVQGYRVPPMVQLEVMRALIPDSPRLLNTWAPTLDWSSLASGFAEFMIGYDTEVEELIQGRLILEEAGGKVTTWDNRRLHFDGVLPQRLTYLASNGAVHEKLADLMARASVPGSIWGYASSLEQRALASISSRLADELRQQRDDTSERISSEIDMLEPSWEHHADLAYIMNRAEQLRTDPLEFIDDVFKRTTPHLASEWERKDLTSLLDQVTRAWRPDQFPLEVLTQALEVAAGDARIHSQLRLVGYERHILEQLRATLVEDSYAVGMRLKRNAIREVQALAGKTDPAPLAPACALSDLATPDMSRVMPNPGREQGFAGLIITGGRGTRLRTSVPKGMIPLGGTPLLQYTVDAIRAASARDLAVVIGYKAELHRLKFGNHLVFIEQGEQHGTAHAVWASRPHYADFSGTLLVSYSDTPFIRPESLRALVDAHKSNGSIMTILTTSRKRHPEFGRVFRQNDSVCAIGQVRFSATESDEVDGGFYCFKAPDFWEFLGQVQNDNNRREFILTEVVSRLYESGQTVATYFHDDPMEFLSANRPAELLQMERLVYLQDKKASGESDDWYDLMWRLHFYEAFGGVRAGEVLQNPTDPHQLEEGRTLAQYYDKALEGEIGPLFRCPAIRRIPAS